MTEKTHRVKIVLNATQNASGAVGKVTSALGGLASAAAGLAAGAAAGVGAVGMAIGKLALDAAPVDQVRQTFEALSKSIGETAETMLADLRAATNGMVNDADLMLSANRFMSMGLAESAEEAAGLAEMATRLGTAMGGTATQSMEDFALMLANQSIPRLDSFGISSGRVRARIDELMASTEGLTREQAFMQAVSEEGAVALERLGSAGATGANVSLEQLKATFENLKLQVGEAFLPVLALLLGTLGDLASQYGPQVAAVLATIGESLGNFMTLVEGGADPVDALRLVLMRMVPQELWDKVNGAMAVLETLRGVVEEVWGFILEQIGVVVAWVQENLPLIQDSGQSLADFWQNVLQPITAGVWEAIKTIIGGALQVVLGIIKTVMQMITGDWSGAWETIKGIGAGVWEAISGAFLQFMDGVLHALGTNLAEFTATWEHNFSEARRIATAIWERIRDTMVTVVTSLVTTIRSRVQDFVQGWQEKFTEVKNTAQTIMTEIRAFIEGFSLVELGRALIQGLIDGVRNMGGALVGAIGGVVQGAIDAAKAALGIASPSKIFEGLGELTVAGYVRGLEPAPAVRATTALMQTVIGSAAPVASTARLSAPVITVQVHATVSNAVDIERMATRVSEVLGQRLQGYGWV